MMLFLIHTTNAGLAAGEPNGVTTQQPLSLCAALLLLSQAPEASHEAADDLLWLLRTYAPAAVLTAANWEVEKPAAANPSANYAAALPCALSRYSPQPRAHCQLLRMLPALLLQLQCCHKPGVAAPAGTKRSTE
jgi:hypothetical protein